ncbi:hypothetical protein M513_05139 [Trichuris suis]|uniref:Immunoglobulin I-set domain protein n=1 Tax=Trichuris suis TaxID=68888 RepID=A0A085M9H6_9BILA|nr:hypothetical protein M513_05139 [Trichuris suis]
MNPKVLNEKSARSNDHAAYMLRKAEELPKHDTSVGSIIRHPLVKALQSSNTPKIWPSVAGRNNPLNVEIPDVRFVSVSSGIKSPVSPRPAREETMEVVISSCSRSPCLSPVSNGLDDKQLTDREHKDIMSSVNESLFLMNLQTSCSIGQSASEGKLAIKQTRKSKEPADINESPCKKWETEEHSWESDYQMGPETLLLQPHDPGFASRIRDYRRCALESPLFAERITLSNLDKRVAVHERRRFSDLLSSDEMLGQLTADVDSKMEVLHSGKMRRFYSSKLPTLVPLPCQEDKRHAPIFERRLKTVILPLFESDITFECKCIANPPAELTWYHNDTVVENIDRNVILINENQTEKLIIKKAAAGDVGVYKCVAENELGHASCSARLILGDLPDRPSRPDIQLASDTEVFIVWDSPAYTGGSESLYYKLEYRRAGENDWSFPWFTISDRLDSTAVVVKRLEPAGIYQFRVLTLTVCGSSVPSLSSRIIQTHRRGAPKLNLDVLRKEFLLNIVNLPASGDLGDIPEEVGPYAERITAFDFNNGTSTENGNGLIQLHEVQKLPTCFQFESEIFQGRFCSIRNAVDQVREHSAHCAVKITPLNEASKVRAMLEYEVLREVKHENIIALLNAFLHEGNLILFMEKLHETILDRFTFKDYYTEEELSKVVVQILTALQWLHFKRIVYLNVLLDNVMFQSKNEWNIKLIDMGAASRMDENGVARVSSDVSRTYFAPEILYDQLATPLSDTWSLGLLCFILLSGMHPFAMDPTCSDEEVIRNVLNERLDINWIFSNTSQEALRFTTLALKKRVKYRMTTEDGLEHKWLSLSDCMRRRRENIRFSSHRLQLFARQYAERMAKNTIHSGGP